MTARNSVQVPDTVWLDLQLAEEMADAWVDFQRGGSVGERAMPASHQGQGRWVPKEAPAASKLASRAG